MAKAKPIEGLGEELAFAEVAAMVLTTRTGELLEHSNGVLDMREIENVHDMRVATRRLRAALEIFAPCFDRDAHSQVLKEVKAIADALGERRDRDVAIESLTSVSRALGEASRPGVESLIARLRSEQARANHELAAFVGEERLRTLAGRIAELSRSARGDLT